MKKFFYSFLLLSSLISNSILFYSRYCLKEVNNEQKKEIITLKQSYPQIYDYLPSKLPSKFQEEVKNGEEIIVYVGRSSCSDCLIFEPKFIEIIKREHLENKIYYLNIAKIRKNEKEWNTFKNTFGIQYTPALARFKNGKLFSKIEWTPEKGADLNNFETWISSNDLNGRI
jgi:predicted bacteriocin transport accessory protein